MNRILGVATVGALLALTNCAVRTADAVIVAVPARAGAVDGTKQNSGEFMWRLFTQFVAPVTNSQASPVVFETWASDKDTFSVTPHWPDPSEPKKLQASVLRAASSRPGDPVDVPCAPPGNAASGGFPASGTADAVHRRGSAAQSPAV